MNQPPLPTAPLGDWEAYLEQRNPHTIDLGLARVQRVYHALALAPTCPVITVAGTNGKGSCVQLLASILHQAGHRVFSHTSPHLFQLNERFQLNMQAVADAQLTQAFAAITAAITAAGDTTNTALTHFEVLVLAALWLARQAQPDVLVLEVGLGGRLDAVNVVDADIAIITNIALDHQHFLGDTREQIGREKAGIFRPGQAAIVGEPTPPSTVLQHAAEIGAVVQLAGRDFVAEEAGATSTGWSWHANHQTYIDLPLPAIQTPLANAAAVIAALRQLPTALQPDEAAIRAGLRAAQLPARLQVFPPAADCVATRVVDVAHNPAAAQVLAQWLRARPITGRTLAVLAMQNDKDHVAVFQALATPVAQWFLAGTPQAVAGARPLTALALAAKAEQAGLRRAQIQVHDTIVAAYLAAVAVAEPGDTVVIFGSFLTATAVLPVLQRELADEGNC